MSTIFRRSRLSPARSTSVFYESDRRSVSASGVDHVMSLFFKHYCNKYDPDVAIKMNEEPDETAVQNAYLARVLCDEELLTM